MMDCVGRTRRGRVSVPSTSKRAMRSGERVSCLFIALGFV